MDDKYVKLPVEQGWQCPVCGAVMSPKERCCINCTGNQKVIFSGGSTRPTIIPPPTITC